jgi:hypothetical protein
MGIQKWEGEKWEGNEYLVMEEEKEGLLCKKKMEIGKLERSGKIEGKEGC